MKKPGKGPISEVPTPDGGGARQRVAEFALQRGITLPKSIAGLSQSPESKAKKKASKRTKK